MFLAELLMRKSYVKLQIAELKFYLLNNDGSSDTNETLKKLYELEDQDQKYRILIKKANSKIEVEVGTSKISLDTAIELRNNLDNKISILSDLISANKKSLDVFNLITQRSKLIEEYLMVYKAIRISEWSTEVD